MSSADLTVVSLSTTCWGAEQSLLLLAETTTAQVLVVAPEGELLTRAAAAGLATQRLEEPDVLRLTAVGTLVGAGRLPAVVAAAARALAALPLWSGGPVVSFSQWLHLPLALAARRRRGIAVLDLHDGPFSRGGSLAQSAAAWTAHRCVATSTTALHHVGSWPRRRSTVVPRPVRLPPGIASRPRAAVAPDTPLRMVVVGRLDPEKRLHVALEAHERLVAGGVATTLDVVGAAHREATAAVSPGQRWPQARFHGRLAHDEALELIARADVLLSTAPGEAFGRTVAEAALLGVPSVVGGGGPAELVAHGRTGFVVPPDDPTALARELQRLSSDRGLVVEVGAAAQANVAAVGDPWEVPRRWTQAVRAA